jgi:hypothetical protein
MSERGKERATFAAKHHIQEAHKLISEAHKHLRKAKSFSRVAELEDIHADAQSLLTALSTHYSKQEGT